MKKTLAFILALIMVFALSVTALADFVPAATASAVTVDGEISSAEWGAPSFKGDKNTNWGYNASYAWDFWQQTTAPADEYYEIWLDHDDQYAYVAVKLTNSFGNDSCTNANDLWSHASLGFTLSAYDAKTTVPRIEYAGAYYEQYDYWCMGLVNGAKTNWNHSQGEGDPNHTLADGEYSIKYNDADKSWSYEMAIPLSKTNITAESEGMVFSMDLRCPIGSGPCASRYLTCPIAQNVEGSNLGAGSFKHSFTNPIIVFTDAAPVEGKIGDTASAFNNVVIDGNFSEEEWGEPVVITNPDHCQATWGNFWRFSPDYVSPLQAIKVYVTNDEENLYIACTADHLDWSANCTSASDLWCNTNFAFDVAKWDDTNTVPHIPYAGDEYEQYVGYQIGFVNGSPVCLYHIQGMDDYEPEYASKYDEAKQTYVYEVKIPFSKTNINIFESTDIALSCAFTEPYSPNCYSYGANKANITMGYVNSGGANNFAHKGNNALKIKLNAPVIPETWISDKASEFSGNIKLDGVVTEEEWGKAIISTIPSHATDSSNKLDFWSYDTAAVTPNQNAKVYLTNDAKNLYIAATIDKAQLDNCTAASELWKHASFGFSVAKWDDTNTVPHIPFEGNDYEQYTSFFFGLVNGTPATVCQTQGIDAWELPAENYAVKYDAATETYTYEVMVPLNKTNINLYDGLDIAFSGSLSQQYTAGDAANIYQFTTGFAFEGGPDNFNHFGNALKITLNDAAKKVETWVLDTAPLLEGEIAIDGKIEDAWGKAVVSTSPDHCQETWGNFWQFDPSSVNKGQNAKLYVTNDEKYLYVGATIDECDFDETCTELGKLYAAAHFGFSVSGYDEENTVKHIPFEGDEYEQYTGFMMGFVNGVKSSWTNTQGHAAWELPAEDYAINYDPETRTYTYECRIPFSKMNVTSSTIAISASIGCNYTGGDAANRYNLTTGFASAGGAYNFAHKDNAIILNLSTNPETGDNFNVIAVVAAASAALIGCAVCIIRKKVNER